MYIYTFIMHTGERKERQKSDTEKPRNSTQPPWFIYMPGVKLRYTGADILHPHPMDEAKKIV